MLFKNRIDLAYEITILIHTIESSIIEPNLKVIFLILMSLID